MNFVTKLFLYLQMNLKILAPSQRISAQGHHHLQPHHRYRAQIVIPTHLHHTSTTHHLHRHHHRHHHHLQPSTTQYHIIQLLWALNMLPRLGTVAYSHTLTVSCHMDITTTTSWDPRRHTVKVPCHHLINQPTLLYRLPSNLQRTVINLR